MRAAKRLRKSKSGNTMIEFAMLAPVFFMLVMGLIEFVLYQYKTYALNHVIYEATRNLQTGEVQNSSDTAVAFHDNVCAVSSTMLNCESIVFDVRGYDEIGDIEFPPVTFDDDGNPTNFVFEPAGPDEYSVVRASIHHQFITPFMAKLMGMDAGLPAIVNSYSVVKNEP